MHNKPQTFAVTTLGCKVNQYESQQIRQLLECTGLRAAPLSAEPDLIVVNTCCVTHIASAKSRQYVSKARKLSPAAAIIVRGCLPTAKTGELNRIDDGVHLISHNQDLRAELLRIITGQAAASKIETADTLSKPANDSKIKYKNKLSRELAPLLDFTGQTRAFLKIQDGCDGSCSYCIVPKVRTILYSKPPGLVLQEAENLVISGHKEIVLSGIFLGAFGRQTVRRSSWPPGQSPLAQLLEQLVHIDGLVRLRLSSLEPADVTPDLLAVFCRHKDIIAPHLHLPLQSGSEKILKRMCRQYTADDFRNTVASLKSRLDRPAITTDVIVGFPGESDEDFQQTIDMANEVGFAKMHIFPFSPRKGTAAFKMRDKLPSGVIKERANILDNLDKQLQDKFRTQFLGERVTVIAEDTAKTPQGRCERYFMVKIPASKAPCRAGSVHSFLLSEDCLPKPENS
jgi:threonylcarbamoyladenosine tRNA methylthiotransferase MtaB